MDNENNPRNNENDSDQGDPKTERNGIGQGPPRTHKGETTEEHEQQSYTSPKPTVPVRLWRGLLRRRVWRKNRHAAAGNPVINWAEKTTVIVTLGIFFVGSIQAYIYWKQKGVMQSTLEQNERAIILNMGQTSIANRNAKTAEAVLETTRTQFRDEQRPYIWLSPFESGVPNSLNTGNGVTLPDLKKNNLPLVVTVSAINGGHSPAVNINLTKTVMIFDTTERAKKLAEDYIPEFSPNPSSNLAVNTGVFLRSTEQPIPITDELLDDLIHDRKRIYILARVQYRDIFSPKKDTLYETAFCQMVNPQGMPFSACDIKQSWIK